MKGFWRMVALATGSAGCAGLVGGPSMGSASAVPFAPGALVATALHAASPTTAPGRGIVPGGPPGLLGMPGTTNAPATSRSSRRTTTIAPTTTRARRGLATPEAAARNLWDGWRDADYARARLFASRGAVDTLFGRKWDPSMRDAGCTVSEDGDPNHRTCTFKFLDGRADLLVEGDAQRGYLVRSVTIFHRESVASTTPGTTTTTPGKGKKVAPRTGRA